MSYPLHAHPEQQLKQPLNYCGYVPLNSFPTNSTFSVGVNTAGGHWSSTSDARVESKVQGQLNPLKLCLSGSVSLSAKGL